LWLAIGDISGTPFDDADAGGGTCKEEAETDFPLPGDTFLCPKYSAAVISGTLDGVIGTAGAAACYDQWEIGDDYTMSNCKGDANNPDDPSNTWYEVLSIRWIGGHVQGFGSRMRVTFYDKDGKFIEDRITSPAFPGGISRNTVVFDQKPIVPCTGFLTIKPAVSFSPSNKVEWAYTTDSPQVGSSDANIWGRKHGICTAGTVGAGCNSDADCGGGGACNITSSVTSIDGAQEKVAPFEIIGTGTLALEIAGRKVPIPKGACCSLDTGNCTSELPWICEEQGNFFQGSGTNCNICSNNIFQSCDEAEGCWACSPESDFAGDLCGCPGGGSCVGNVCDGGTRSGGDCNQCTGGSCDTTPFCLPSPPACQISACCGDTDGSCTQVTGNLCVDFNGVPTGQGACANDSQCTLAGSDTCRIASGTCSAGANAGEFCVGDVECPDGECVAPCPVGSTSRGFGTKCRPNCCEQSVDTGADLCTEAPIVVINVPTVTEPPVTYTWTSNNKSATFGDRVEGVGENDPPTGTCTSVIFSEVGGFRDRGWWHAFSIDNCANVRVDHCCTFEIDGRIHQPAWAQLWNDCDPCTVTTGGSIVGPGTDPNNPIGTKTDPNARGGPFCDFDDLWTTYGPLPKGIYRYATYSGSGGHFGVFQLHVTVGACVEAACCLGESLCVGGPLVGSVCNVNEDCAPSAADQVCVDDDNRPNELCCPGGACNNDPQNPVCVDGSRAGMLCCDGGGTCKGNCPAGCQVLIEPECDALGGFWMGFGSIPLDDDPTTICETGVCDAGSCCTGPGECLEDAIPNCTPGANCCADGNGTEFCMDKKTCLDTNGSFVGGARCEFQKNPCPACQIEDSNNCHNLDGVSFTGPSDLSMKPGGFVQADDIVLTGSGQINQVCVWGVYFDGLNGPAGNHSCSGEVKDDFRVRFYEDDGNGKPDHTALIAQAGGNPAVATFLGGTHVGPVAVAKSDTPDGTLQTVDPLNLEVFTLTFSTMEIPTGVTVWLEVANNTDTPTGADAPQFNTCDWWWAQSQNIFVNSTGTGNEWAYAGTDYRPAGYPTDDLINPNYVARDGDTGYTELGHDWRDQVFCLAGPSGSTNFTDPDPPTGSCCDCTGVFTDDQTLAQCTSRNTQHENRWGRGLVGAASCLPVEGVPGDDCGTPAAGAVAAGLDCSAGEPIEGNAITILDGGFEAQSVCANDTLPQSVQGAANFLGGDFFANYVTTCTGELVLSMCHSGTFYGNFDSFMAVHTDRTADCPCPSDSTDRLLAFSDEGCNGEADGGSGVVQGLIVFPGECYTARLGGWGASLAGTARGNVRLDVGCIARSCFPSAQPELQTQFDPVANAGAPEPKNRVLPIKAGDPGQEQTIRVKWDSQPNWAGGHTALVGQTKWMEEPFQVCENSGEGFGVSPPSCSNAPGQPQKWFWAARLNCDPAGAHYADLSKLTDYCTGTGEPCTTDGDCAQGTCGVDGVIHLIDRGIVGTKNANQQAIYSVQVIEKACSVDAEDNFSDALVVVQPPWGDIGSGTGCPLGPPNGSADLVPDVTGALNKFSNGFCAPKKTRADAGPDSLDMNVGISDVLTLLNAFSSGSSVFPFAAGSACAANAKVAQNRVIRSR
jgi:hypothetical protein